jgi:hypothetical protein
MTARVAGRPTLRTRARRSVRAVSRTTGRLTSGLRMAPTFLIVGAQRCGTTSMFKTLAQHPAVLPVVLHKGVHYFDVHYDKGMPWYLGHFPLRHRARAVQERLGVAPATGESSPYYLFHPLAAERIARDLPDVRLIVLLRDPVERAYSAFTHERARGYEAESFEQALEMEAGRLAGEVERMAADPSYDSHHWRHNAYVTRGQYVDQMERLEGLVGRDRMHVMDSDTFFTDPRPAFEGVCRFLDLPVTPGLIGGVSFDQHNARPRAPLAATVRARLEAHYAPYDDRLAAWWGCRPSWRP